MNVYRGTGLQAFKSNGSSVERAAIRHIEGKERIKKIQQTINERKEKIIETLNIDELFSEVLNIVSQ